MQLKIQSSEFYTSLRGGPQNLRKHRSAGSCSLTGAYLGLSSGISRGTAPLFQVEISDIATPGIGYYKFFALPPKRILAITL